MQFRRVPSTVSYGTLCWHQGRRGTAVQRPWWGGSQARLDWRCLVLRLFEPSDDPAHPRVVDDLLAYRGMQRAFEERSDYRGCRDMEAYCDEYDPDRAYHLPPWRPRAANLRPRRRHRHRSRSSHRTRRPEHSVCDARRTAPRVANTLVGNGAAHHSLPRLRNAHARNGTLQTQQRSPLSLTRWHTLKLYGYLLLLLLHRLAAPATAHTHTRHTSCCIIGTTSA